MTNHRSDPRSKPTEAAKVVRLVDAKSARKEATPPNDGIRPTREGPWDPCRFQEYEISPEFRRQIMTAKPPPVDPAIFAETFPPTPIADVIHQVTPLDPLREEALGASGLSEQPSATTNSAVTSQPKSTHWIKLLILIGTVLGLAAGFLVARLKSHRVESREAIAPTVSMSKLLGTTPMPVKSVIRADARPPEIVSQETPSARQSPNPSPSNGLGKSDSVETKSKQGTVEPSKTTTATKRHSPNVKSAASTESFPMSPEE